MAAPTDEQQAVCLQHATEALSGADALLIATGAGMGVDSGLGTFRGRNAGVWPPLKALNMDFSEMSIPNHFETDPRLAWAFWHFRHQAYTLGAPHAGYDILAKWGGGLRYGLFSVTSNIDGHWARTAGVGPERLYECHGAVTRMQTVEDAGDGDIWPTDAAEIAALNVPTWDLIPGEEVEISLASPDAQAPWLPAVVGDDGASMMQDGKRVSARGVRRPGGPDLMRVTPGCPLPTCPKTGLPTRPNVLMFYDGAVNVDVIERQQGAFSEWLDGIPKSARLVIVEVGAGLEVPTIRGISQRTLRQFPQGALVRINLDDSEVGSARSSQKAVSVGGFGALEALTRIDQMLGETRAESLGS